MHSVLDCSCNLLVACLGNFLHKARYGGLPLKHTWHRLYWGKADDGSSVACAPPATARSDRVCLVKWMARQLQFNDQVCHLCPARLKETTRHVLGGECALQTQHNLTVSLEIQGMIRDKASSH
jgi:hypothetical protein